MAFPNLLTYSDYRQYLRDYYEVHKAANADFSFRYLSLRAGINSSAFYKYVIDGKRNLTKGSLLKTCAALNLKDREAEYFENLVFFNQAKTLQEKNLFFDRLTKLRGHYETRRVEKEQYAYYSEWHHAAVREMLACMVFKGDHEDLGRRLAPPLSAAKVRESMTLLGNLGLARKDAQGRWTPSDPVLVTGSVDAPEIDDFKLRMLLLASEAFTRFPSSQRLMSSTTFSVSEETLNLFKRRIRELRSELLDMARLDTATDRVYELSINLFPLCVIPEKKRVG